MRRIRANWRTDSLFIGPTKRLVTLTRLVLLHADPLALRAPPFSLLVVDVPFEFPHGDFAALAGHGALLVFDDRTALMPDGRQVLAQTLSHVPVSSRSALSFGKKGVNMKIVLRVAGVLLVFFGCIWFLQGVNVLPGSFMTGQIQWAVYGAVAVVVGIGLLFAAKRPTLKR